MPVIDAPESVDELRLIAERMADRVHSGVAVDIPGFDDELVSFPMPNRFAEPGRRKVRVVSTPICSDNVEPCVLFRKKNEVVIVLNDLDRMRTVNRPG